MIQRLTARSPLLHKPSHGWPVPLLQSTQHREMSRIRTPPVIPLLLLLVCLATCCLHCTSSATHSKSYSILPSSERSRFLKLLTSVPSSHSYDLGEWRLEDQDLSVDTQYGASPDLGQYIANKAKKHSPNFVQHLDSIFSPIQNTPATSTHDPYEIYKRVIKLGQGSQEHICTFGMSVTRNKDCIATSKEEDLPMEVKLICSVCGYTFGDIFEFCCQCNLAVAEYCYRTLFPHDFHN